MVRHLRRHNRAAAKAVWKLEQGYRRGDVRRVRDALRSLEHLLDVMAPDHPDRPACLHNLASGRTALDNLTRVPGDVPAGPALIDLSSDVRRHALQAGRPELLIEAAELARRAVRETGPDDPDRPLVLSQCGNTLHALYIYRERSPATLRESVAMGRAAVEAAPDGYVHRKTCLNNLGIALRTLFEETGDLTELREAVQVGQAAVALAEAGSSERPRYLANLSASGQELFKRTHQRQAIQDAAAAALEAVELSPPGTTERAGRLTELANALHLLSQVSDVETLRQAVQVAREAVGAGLPGDIAHPARLNNLAIVARALFERTGDRSALDEAVRAGREAVRASAPGTVSRALPVMSLVRALAQQPPGPQVVREMSGHCASLTPQNSTPRTRAIVSVLLGAAATAAGDHETARTAYGTAVDLLPELAPRRLLRADREHGLAEFAGLPADAAAAALNLGRPAEALRLLERARGLLLWESVGARRDLEALRRTDAAAAGVLADLRDQFDAADRAGVDLYGAGAGPVPLDRTRTHRDLAGRWEELIADIRRRPGLADFLRPPTAMAPARSPIVVVNASRFRCDALIVTADEPVRVVRLACDYPEMLARARAFQDGPIDQRDLTWLRDTVVTPVLTELRLLSPSPEPPRIWWCPVGIASFLPLHAAALDQVVSSYVATLGALPPRAAPPGSGLLMVEMSRTPGARPLPGASAEARHVAELVPGLTVLSGPAATREAVLAALPHHRIAHFACHAVTDPQSPALNRLLLHDHLSAPLTAIEMSALDTTVDLAYLSACETARSSEALADEAVHIATAFQLAGCRHVIATLWPVADAAAGRIATDFYTALGPSLDTDDTARALHRAVRALREDAVDRPSLWAAHIHLESA